ncbi:MAG: response regulator [Selenomonadaceae bacterium]|nr:response regulator [Selenomonadaceae bacterium]
MQNFKPEFYEKILSSLSTNAVLMRVSADGKYFPIWCSKEFTEMMEGTAEEFIELERDGKMKSIHPEDREEVAYLFQHHVTKSGTNSLNVRKRTLKGNWRWVSVHYSFVEENGVQYAYCMYFDITTIKENENQARVMYESVKNELENISGESLVSLRLNLTKGIVEDCRGHGLHEVDVRGMSIAKNFEKRLDIFPLERDKRRFQRNFNTKKLLAAYQNGITNLSDIFFCHLNDGQKCFVEYSITLSKDPSTGDVICFVNERECNKEMVNKAILHKVLVEQYDMITYIVDGNYGIVIGETNRNLKGSVIPRETNGSYVQYIEEQVKPILGGSERERKKYLEMLNLKRIEKSLSQHEPYEANVILNIDGENFYKRFVFYTVSKEAKFYILLKSDTTKLQREQITLNEQLKTALDTANQANVAKTAFLSSMSHEMRTPMNAIIGLGSIALKEPNLPPKTREQLTKIGDSARHLLSLINDILDMSRIESGRMVLKNEEFSFSNLLEQINTMFGGQCAIKGLTYDCHVVGNVDEFYIGDATKLKQVLINILGNAVKFTPAPGKITFTIENAVHYENKTTLRFTIKDTGIGMDENYLPKIFDVFSQEDSTSLNAYGGTGLGMPITKNIVEMMNGNISVRSKKHVGSEFIVSLTLKNSDSHHVTKGNAIDTQGLRVLVVDDDSIACEHAKLILEDLGIAADTVLNGIEALEMVKLHHARHEPYNAMLIDWRMPELDGIELTRRVREIIGNESAIIILTAYSWEEVMDEALAAGVDSFIAKPLFAATLLEEFNRALENKQILLGEEKESVDLDGKHILIAEDMFVNAEIIKEILSMMGMEVDHAENGKLVVEMFEKSPPNYYDAILMDIRMPVMDGLQATENIRALAREDSKTIPIIALTANAFDEDVQRSLQAGMNAHLTKPVEPEHLYETLKEFISARPKS